MYKCPAIVSWKATGENSHAHDACSMSGTQFTPVKKGFRLIQKSAELEDAATSPDLVDRCVDAGTEGT